MMLFHSFPRPRERDAVGSTYKQGHAADQVLDRGFRTLQNIAHLGLVCTPESFRLDRLPLRLARHPSSKAEESWPFQQSRLCFTLCEPTELFERKIRGLAPGTSGPRQAVGEQMSHADLFGAFAVGIDPIVARRLGIVPTNYFAPNDIFGSRFSKSSQVAGGLNIQLISALYKIYQVISVLAFLEADLTIDDVELPSKSILHQLEVEEFLPTKNLDAVTKLCAKECEKIVRIFDTDRVPALYLLSSLHMMLNLFQETDSTIDGTTLAFFEQREWRLIHGVRDGMVWYCLGDQPAFRNPHRLSRKDQIKYLRQELERNAGRNRGSRYFDNCWVLESVDGYMIADYIKLIIVPMRVYQRVLDVLGADHWRQKVAIAEDFGYEPKYSR